MITLRPYQEKAISRTLTKWEAGDRSGLIVLPTGTGKTFTAVQLGKQQIHTPFGLSGRILWLAHREELLTQALKAFAIGFPEAMCSLVIGPQALRSLNEEADGGTRSMLMDAYQRRWDGDVIVASIQSVNARRHKDIPKDISVVVIDEAHHAQLTMKAGTPPEVSGNSYGKLLTFLRKKNPDLRVVGLTATPFRADGRGLGGLFSASFDEHGLPSSSMGQCFHCFTMLDAIRQGWLAPFWRDPTTNQFSSVQVKTEADLSAVHSRGGDFVERELAKAVNTPERNRSIVEAWLKHAKGRPTVVFGVDVGDPRERTGHVFTLTDAFVKAGVRAEPVWGSMPRDKRKKVQQAYEAGRVDVLVNCGVFTEGWDSPRTSCVVIARPTKALGLYQQMIGRGTRLFPGKEDLLVLDCADATPKGGAALRNLADLTVERPIDHETGMPIIDLTDEVGEAGPPDRDKVRKDEHGRLDWTAVSVPFIGAEKPIYWARIGRTRTLDLGDRRVVMVVKEASAWRACVVDTEHKEVEWLTNPFAAADDEIGAISLAEEMIRRSGVHARAIIKHRPGSWHSQQPVTEAQYRWLSQRWRFLENRDGRRAGPLAEEHWDLAKAGAVVSWAFALEVLWTDRTGRAMERYERESLIRDIYVSHTSQRAAA